MYNLRDALRPLYDEPSADTTWDAIWSTVVTAANTDHGRWRRHPLVALMLPDVRFETIDWDEIWKAASEASAYRVEQALSISTQDHNATPKQSAAQTTQASAAGQDQQAASAGHPENAGRLAARGLRFKLAAFAFIGLGIGLLVFLDTQIDRVGAHHKLAIQLITPFWLYIAFLLHRNGRYFAQRAKELATHDSRPPVLYLRAFSTDEDAAEQKTPSLTEEEQLVSILRAIGPVVALDAPGGHQRFPGAMRAAVSDATWQKFVQARIGEARLVVLRLADTPAVFWEFEQARCMLQPNQLVLIVPSHATHDYARCQAFAAQLLDMSLPEVAFQDPVWRRLARVLTRARTFENYYSFRGFVIFDDCWHGTFMQPKLSLLKFLHSPLNQVGRASILFCLKPVFERLSVTWDAPPLNPITVAVIGSFSGGVLWATLSHLLD